MSRTTLRIKPMAAASSTSPVSSSFPVTLLLLLLLLSTQDCPTFAVSRSTAAFLPGFQGPLPFHLETGYVGVGESEGVQLFYYFVKSERNPRQDPLILWLTGGPGCSALSSLLFEIGSLHFRMEEYNGTLPTLVLNPDSWTKVSSIIFVDLPAHTGFSYTTFPIAPQRSDSKQIQHAVQFLNKWLTFHPEFHSNPMYIGGDSYSGMIVPAVALEISKGINFAHILEPTCFFASPKPQKFSDRRSLDGMPVSLLASDPQPSLPPIACRNYQGLLSQYWANDGSVHKALGIRQGSIGKWVRCIKTPYTKEIESSVPFHASLSAKGYRALIYSGDHDLVVPFLGTQAWIRSLNYSVLDEWRPWLVKGQVAGYTRTYSNEMTYATVKGGGHTAPEQPEECFAMFERWISHKPL
ncbi:LOW QUALITY PROTEIN: serine carboxypeptidase-like 18 [Prosopis cineraria]|uniref:LOW QUALITY PROTEIN: serine carboxypeptidase-like 18 n=1 Tax=Prosopis cineraria TaxID=364024 RepID=UPI00240FBAB4|nr:LOW QUALITY PROTEIN: serine carboxypeptidase-like 18 [Prosopis cineraria]